MTKEEQEFYNDYENSKWLKIYLISRIMMYKNKSKRKDKTIFYTFCTNNINTRTDEWIDSKRILIFDETNNLKKVFKYIKENILEEPKILWLFKKEKDLKLKEFLENKFDIKELTLLYEFIKWEKELWFYMGTDYYRVN